MRVIKKDAIIKGIDFAIPYYERLQGLVMHLAEGGEPSKAHLDTVLILINTLDEAAEKQGLIEEMELDVVPPKE